MWGTIGCMEGGIEEVARAAGVSTATVSRALRGLPNVKESTRLHVQQVALSLGYTPTPSASSLASGRTRTVGLLTPWISRWFHSNVIEGAGRSLRAEGFAALLYSFELDSVASRPPVNLDVLRRRVDAVLVVGMTMTADEVAMLDTLGLPIVFVGSGPPDHVRVHVDDVDAARCATEHLLGLGHTRIGHIGGYRTELTPWASEVQRHNGYVAAMEAAGVAADPALTAYGRFMREGGRTGAAQLLDTVPDLTAMFVESDEMAFGALTELSLRRLRVPDDISVISIDGHPVGELVGLTTRAQDAQTLGATAAEMLLEMITGAPVERDVVYPTELVLRTSTRAL